LQLSEAIAAARHTTPRKLSQALKGDLDTIVLQALKKSPADRYRSIDAFARDIANHLSNLPVSARPDGTWYRMQRFVSRNRWQVAATVAMSLSIIGGAGTAVWQAHATAQQRDRALALASRNRAINDFTSMLIGEAASAEQPVTVKEMLDRSESLAMAGIVGTSGDQAAVLETIGTLRLYAGDTGKASQAFERAATLAATAGEAGMKSRLTCLYATALSNMGKIEDAKSTIARELEHLEYDDENAAECFAAFATVVQRASDADSYFQNVTRALERFRHSGLERPAKEAELLGMVATGYALLGDNARANNYFEMSQRTFRKAGREHSPVALVSLSNWAVMAFGSGVPKRSLDLYDQILSIFRAREPDATPPVFVLSNRARMLVAIGRFAQARSEYERTLQVARHSKNLFFEADALINLASLSQQSGDGAAATGYLQQLDASLGPALSKYGMLMTPRQLTQGRIDLEEGKLDAARAQFDAVLNRARNNHIKNGGVCFAYLGKAEADLLSGDAKAAAANARAALELAVSLQGGVPYSDVTGRSSLVLGRALQAQGDLAPAHEAIETAVLHLSNTIDADHPDLVRARELLAVTSDPNFL
jgi:eukaryotic-like serine/threonine-protein kinase